MTELRSCIAVSVCSPEPVTGLGLRAALEGTGFGITACHGSEHEMWTALDGRAPAILIIDTSLREGALRLVRLLRMRCSGTRLVAWMSSSSAHLAMELLELGVRGILHKNATIASIRECLARVHDGAIWLEPELAPLVDEDSRPRLSEMQNRLAELVAAGLANKQIAHELHITEGTVKVYLSKLFKKVNVRDRVGLASYAMTHFRNPASGQQRAGANWVPGDGSGFAQAKAAASAS